MEPSNEQKLNQLKEWLIEKKQNNIRIQREIYYLKNDIDLIEYLMNLYNLPNNIHQLLYTIVNGLNSSFCKCGKTKKFLTYSKGYLETCGNKSCIDKKRTAELKKSSLLKYGVDHPTKVQSTKDKYKKTMIEKYGVSHNWKGHLRESGKKTMIEKYGVQHALQNPMLKQKRNNTTISNHGTLDMLNLDKTKQTNLKIYGFENAAQSDIIINKIKQSEKLRSSQIASEKLIKYDIHLINYENGYYTLRCSKCNNIFIKTGSSVNLNIRTKTDPCPFCNVQKYDNKRYSKSEKEFANFIIENIEQNSVTRNVRTLIKNREIDILIPKLNIGIEFNGTYWHSELEKHKEYHFDKTKMALANGTRLFHVWEDDWNLKNNIVKSMILNLIGKSTKIYARKCNCEIITNKEAEEFCKINHLKSSKHSTIAYGLKYNEKLMSVMTFTKKKEYWELDRFCTLLNHSIVGGASKLFKHFIKNNNPNKIVSYCDIDITPDPEKSVYKKLGFELIGRTMSYSWVIDGVRLNRTNFMKYKLVKEGFSKDLTETEIMQSRGYYRTFECGNWRFEYLSN